MSFLKATYNILILACISCQNLLAQSTNHDAYPDVQVVGAMKNVMWKGELGGCIYLDTISNKKGLYGLGPESYLTGEILIANGQSYVSHVTSDSTMSVQKTFDASAPFLVYAHVNEWHKVELPKVVKTIQDLEAFINEKTSTYKQPFAFTLSGRVESAVIHIQNLPKGTKVSSPEEAHQSQMKYNLENEIVDITGFFSTVHQGIFTHHDSFLHMHLITGDESKMGHLDEIIIDHLTLYLPKG